MGYGLMPWEYQDGDDDDDDAELRPPFPQPAGTIRVVTLGEPGDDLLVRDRHPSASTATPQRASPKRLGLRPAARQGYVPSAVGTEENRILPCVCVTNVRVRRELASARVAVQTFGGGDGGPNPAALPASTVWSNAAVTRTVLRPSASSTTVISASASCRVSSTSVASGRRTGCRRALRLGAHCPYTPVGRPAPRCGPVARQVGPGPVTLPQVGAAPRRLLWPGGKSSVAGVSGVSGFRMGYGFHLSVPKAGC